MAICSPSFPVRQRAWRPEEVPPFPAVALKALNLMAGKDTSLLELCSLVRPDVAFSTEILRIANSPLIAFSKEITSVVQASMLLGFQRLKNIVITVGLRAYLAEPFSPVLQSCWRHSVACAMIAEQAAKASYFDQHFAYAAGIMHDIGRVVLAVSMPREYACVIERGADQPHDLLLSERALCGIDHCQVGAILVKEWALPEVFSAITACHHDSDPRVTDMASLASLACLLADSLGFGVVSYRSPRGYAEILSGLPEATRNGFPADVEDLTSKIAAEIKMIESA